MIIQDGDIIVTSLTLNGCVTPQYRAHKSEPVFCFIASLGSSRANAPKSAFLSVRRQLRATFTRPLINSVFPCDRRIPAKELSPFPFVFSTYFSCVLYKYFEKDIRALLADRDWLFSLISSNVSSSCNETQTCPEIDL